MGLGWDHFEDTKFPLAKYASNHFGEHVCLAGGDHGDPLESLLKAFFAFHGIGFQKLCSILRNPLESISFNGWPNIPSYPLYHTCKYGFYQTTKSLLEETTKSWLEETTKSWLEMSYLWPFSSTMGDECIAAAASHGHLEVVKLLLENGADGESAFQVAVRHCHFEIAKLLLENGDNGGSALLLAAHHHDLGVTKFLLENGVNVNSEDKGGTALKYAILGGDMEIVRLLLDHGADMNAQRGAALQQAILHHDMEVVKLLLGHGGKTPLQLAADHVELIKLLLENGADVNAKGEYDETALHWAASGGHLNVVRLLLQNGADVNAEGYDGTALQQAASGGHLEVVILLLDNGADVKADHGTRAALQQAASSGCKAALKLLQHEADVDATGGKDGTSLQRAELQRRTKIAELLINYDEGGTTVHHTTSAGDTPLAGLLLEKPEQGISVGQAEIQPFPVESEEDRVDAGFKMDVLDLDVVPKSASKNTIMPLKDKDLDADVRKRVSTLVEKHNKRRKTGIQIDIFTLDLQLTSWYSGSGMAIKVKAAEEEDEDEAEELQMPEAKLSAASEEREDEAEPQEKPEAGSSKGKEREMDVESDKGK